MYGMPPFNYMWPMPQNNEMNPKEFIETMKLWDEFMASKKPKEDKKNPDAWGTSDYFMLYAFIHMSAAVILACYVLSTVEQIVKAISH